MYRHFGSKCSNSRHHFISSRGILCTHSLKSLPPSVLIPSAWAPRPRLITSSSSLPFPSPQNIHMHNYHPPLLPNILRPDPNLLTPLPNTLPLHIPTQRLPHIKRILPIIIIVHHASIDTVAHLPIQFLCDVVACSDEEIHEPGIVCITAFFEGLCESGCVAETAGGWRDGESRYVAVPGEIVGVGVCGGVEGGYGARVGRGFEFA